MDNSNNGDATKNGKATTGLVLGIIGMVAWLLPIAGAPVTIVGLVFGIKGLKSQKHTKAVIAIVLSSIGLVLTVINAALGAYMGVTAVTNNERTSTSTPAGVEVASNTEFINQAVQEVKSQIKLPFQVDQVTKMTDVTAEPSAIRYHYALSGIDAKAVTNELLKESIVQNICSNKDTRIILDRGVNMEYSYVVENSNQKFFVSLAKKDCK